MQGAMTRMKSMASIAIGAVLLLFVSAMAFAPTANAAQNENGTGEALVAADGANLALGGQTSEANLPFTFEEADYGVVDDRVKAMKLTITNPDHARVVGYGTAADEIDSQYIDSYTEGRGYLIVREDKARDGRYHLYIVTSKGVAHEFESPIASELDEIRLIAITSSLWYSRFNSGSSGDTRTYEDGSEYSDLYNVFTPSTGKWDILNVHTGEYYDYQLDSEAIPFPDDRAFQEHDIYRIEKDELYGLMKGDGTILYKPQFVDIYTTNNKTWMGGRTPDYKFAIITLDGRTADKNGTANQLWGLAPEGNDEFVLVGNDSDEYAVMHLSDGAMLTDFAYDNYDSFYGEMESGGAYLVVQNSDGAYLFNKEHPLGLDLKGKYPPNHNSWGDECSWGIGQGVLGGFVISRGVDNYIDFYHDGIEVGYYVVEYVLLDDDFNEQADVISSGAPRRTNAYGELEALMPVGWYNGATIYGWKDSGGAGYTSSYTILAGGEEIDLGHKQPYGYGRVIFGREGGQDDEDESTMLAYDVVDEKVIARGFVTNAHEWTVIRPNSGLDSIGDMFIPVSAPEGSAPDGNATPCGVINYLTGQYTGLSYSAIAGSSAEGSFGVSEMFADAESGVAFIPAYDLNGKLVYLDARFQKVPELVYDDYYREFAVNVETKTIAVSGAASNSPSKVYSFDPEKSGLTEVASFKLANTLWPEDDHWSSNRVYVSTDGDSSYGAVDRVGNTVVEPDYRLVGRFHHNLLPFAQYDREWYEDGADYELFIYDIAGSMLVNGSYSFAYDLDRNGYYLYRGDKTAIYQSGAEEDGDNAPNMYYFYDFSEVIDGAQEPETEKDLSEEADEFVVNVPIWPGNSIKDETNVPVVFGRSLFGNSYTYNHKLAKLGIVLSMVAYSESISDGKLQRVGKSAPSVETDVKNDVTLRSRYLSGAKQKSFIYRALRALGAKNDDIVSYYYSNDQHSWRTGVYSNSYADEGGYGVCGYSIGSRKMYINGQVRDLVFVLIRGTASNGEWNSNFNVSNSSKKPQELHQGFREAKDQIENSLKEFCKDRGINSSNSMMFVTGHSRGAAVANMLAGSLDDGSGNLVSPANLFAYTFATPNVSLKSNVRDKLYRNICNILNPEDFVTKVPLELWGYHRYGVDKTLPSRSLMSASRYDQLLALCNASFRRYFHDSKEDYHYEPYPKGTQPVDNLVSSMYQCASSVDEYYRSNFGSVVLNLTQLVNTPYDFFEAIASFLALGEGANLSGYAAEGLNTLVRSASRYAPIAAFFAYEGKIDPHIFEAHKPETYFAWMYAFDSSGGLYSQSDGDNRDGAALPGSAGKLGLQAEGDDEEALAAQLYEGAYKIQRVYGDADMTVRDSKGTIVCRVENGVADENVMKQGLIAGKGASGEIVVYLPAGESYAVDMSCEGSASYALESYDNAQELVAHASSSQLGGAGKASYGVAIGSGADLSDCALKSGDGSDVALNVAGAQSITRHAIVVESEGSGDAWGSGSVYDGDPAFLHAEPLGLATFEGWYDGETLVSTQADYTFVPSGDVHLTAKFSEIDLGKSATVADIPDQTYSGSAKTPSVVVSVGEYTLVKDQDYTVTYKDNTAIGTATATITGVGRFKGVVTKTFEIVQASGGGSEGGQGTNPGGNSGGSSKPSVKPPSNIIWGPTLIQLMTAKANKAKFKVKYAKLKKKKQTIPAKKAFTVKNAIGKVTYQDWSYQKKISVSSAGKITLKKGLKKGTYKMEVRVRAAGDSRYMQASETVKFKIIVK